MDDPDARDAVRSGGGSLIQPAQGLLGFAGARMRWAQQAPPQAEGLLKMRAAGFRPQRQAPAELQVGQGRALATGGAQPALRGVEDRLGRGFAPGCELALGQADGGLHGLPTRHRAERGGGIGFLQQRPKAFGTHTGERLFHDDAALKFDDFIGGVATFDALPTGIGRP